MNRQSMPHLTYRVALTLSGGLLLSGLLGEGAIAQTSYENAPRPLTGNFLVEAKPILPKPGVLQPTTTPLPVAEPIAAPQETPTRLMLRLGERRVEVYRGETLAASYPVAVGKPGWETPTGEFEVLSTVVDPGWTSPFTNEVVPPGPNSPLGDRWIAFWTDGENMIGFHGTPNRDSVGQAASHGCVRMYNEHIRELFELVQIGTPVTVVL